jgi:NADH-quinone oxidoreductase subunit H
MMYGLVQLGSYLKLYAFAALFVVLFLGGWNGPMIVPAFPEQIITEGIEMGPITLTVDGLGPLLHDTITQEMLNGTLWFVLKTAGVIFFIILPRGVFPRVRVDLLLNLGWTKLIGLCFINIFIALGLLYAGVLGPGGLQ